MGDKNTHDPCRFDPDNYAAEDYAAKVRTITRLEAEVAELKGIVQLCATNGYFMNEECDYLRERGLLEDDANEVERGAGPSGAHHD